MLYCVYTSVHVCDYTNVYVCPLPGANALQKSKETLLMPDLYPI